MVREKGKSIVYVENGQVTDELFSTAKVELENDRVRLLRGRPMAFARREIGRGDFYITAELCLIDKAIGPRGEKARYLYIADPAFLFSGESSWVDGEIDLRTSAYIPEPVRKYNTFSFSTRGYYRLKGPIIGNFQKDIIRKKNSLLEGEYFTFEAIREGNTLTFIVNGDEIYTVPYSNSTFGKFGFSSLGNHEVNLRSFKATASDFQDWLTPPAPTKYSPGYDVPVIDLTGSDRYSIVAPGDDVFAYTKGDEKFETSGGFQHPNTLLADDGESMFCVFTVGHGGRCGPMKVSRDSGVKWEWIQSPVQWHEACNCPCIHAFTCPEGMRRYIVFASSFSGNMVQSVSLDEGRTWAPFSENGLRCIVPMISIHRISPGHYITIYDNPEKGIATAKTWDGGITWHDETQVFDPRYPLYEPCIVPSPNGDRLLVMLRENSFWYNSYAIFSDDGGETWSEPYELPGSVTGHRHLAKYDDDGRIVMVFRDMARGTKTPADFVAWVGTFDDLINAKEGQYRIRLIDNSTHSPDQPGNTGYAGLERLSDGTFVATTYAVVTPGDRASIVSTRFTLSEVDACFRSGRFL